MPTVHHFVPTLEPGAVGGHVLQARRLCRDLGWRSEVFAEHIRPVWASEGRSYRDYGRAVRAARDDVLVYHMAIGSVVADFVGSRMERLVVDHHNITPPAYFAGWEPDVVHGLAWGRHQLAVLAPRAVLGVADSAFNEDELIGLGYAPTAVAPILLDPAALDHEVDADLVDRLREESAGGSAWLFVSRVAPNKCQHDLVKALAVHRRAYGGRAVLRIVGAPASDRYADAVRSYAAELGVADAVQVTGAVTDGQLGAHYRAADVYVSASEHEGFALTLLEAMHHGVPVVGYAGAAVGETVGEAGLCLERKDAPTMAAAVHRVLSDDRLRAALVAAGRARVADFALPRTRDRMRAALESVL